MIGRILAALSMMIAAIVFLTAAPSYAEDEDKTVTFKGDVVWALVGMAGGTTWANQEITFICKDDRTCSVDWDNAFGIPPSNFDPTTGVLISSTPWVGDVCGDYTTGREVDLTVTADSIIGNVELVGFPMTKCDETTSQAATGMVATIDFPRVAGNPCIIDPKYAGCEAEATPTDEETDPAEVITSEEPADSDSDDSNPLIPIIIATITGVAAITAVAATASASAKNKAKGSGKKSPSTSNIANQVAGAAQRTGDFVTEASSNVADTVSNNSNASNVSGTMKNIADQTVNIAKDTANFAGEVAESAANSTEGTQATDVTNTMKNIADQVANTAKDTSNFASEASSSVTNTAGNTNPSTVTDAMKNIAEQVGNVGKDTAGFVGSAADHAANATNSGSTNAPSQTVKTIASEVADAASELGDAAGDQADKIIRPKK